MTNYLLDCNHLSPALRKTSKLRNRIEQRRLAGDRFICCHPVLCELEAGIQHTPKPDENRRQLSHLLNHIRLWPLDLELRRKGRVLSQVDIMLAALARQHKLTLLTSDLDFQALPDLTVEDWTV